MSSEQNIDVLVVGAGPTGLTLACELIRHGLTVRIVDGAAEPDPHSRAIAVHARTLEIFDDLGIGAGLVARGKKLLGATLWAGAAEPIARIDFETLHSRHNYLLTVAQSETEAALNGLLERHGGKVERGTRFTSLRQDGTGVTVKLTADGAESVCRAAWVVGCDGAHSAVRAALEIPFVGESHDEGFFVADVEIAWDVRDDRIATWFGDDGFVACFPMVEGRWRVLGTVQPGDERSEPPTLEIIETMVRMLSGVPATVTNASWLARFQVHSRQVAHYRDDRVFLAGDAAHTHSPVGGQGMNMGIQDAHNLAWKLALVHRGDARGLLLDSYGNERHAVGRSILRSSDAAMKLGVIKSAPVRGTRNQVARFLTGFETIQQMIAENLSELGVTYQKSNIVHEDVTGLLHARIGTAAGGETPTLGSVREFSLGPIAGQRAPDGKVTSAGEGGTKRLMQTLDSRKHTILLFDGRSTSAEGYARFGAIAAQVRKRFGARVDLKVVTPRSARPSELAADVTVLLDPDGELERQYAASTECAYVIRPDLWIGYRSQPADEQKLTQWLAGFLR